MKRLLLSLAILLFVGSVQSHAALNAYIYLKGKSGKTISFQLQSFSCASSPRDIASGLPTGRRTYEPIVFTKKIDKASPSLSYILQRNESDFEVTLVCRKAGGTPTDVMIKIHLRNCAISSQKQMDSNGNVVSENGKSSGKGGTPVTEEVSFLFQKVEWEQATAEAKQATSWEAILK